MICVLEVAVAVVVEGAGIVWLTFAAAIPSTSATLGSRSGDEPSQPGSSTARQATARNERVRSMCMFSSMGVRAITPGHGVCTWLHPMTREKGWQPDIIPEMRPRSF
jgi:hypothetical protein